MTDEASAAALAHPWSKDTLLAKAQRYAEKMEADAGEGWETVFWSTLVLELLARAALASVSPVLLAYDGDWRHSYFALGHQPKKKKYVPRSADISDVFARLQETMNLEPRLADFGALHMQRRNEELHTGNLCLDDLKSSLWLPLFYETCDGLLQIMAEDLAAVFSQEAANSAKEMIEAARDESAKVIQGEVQKHSAFWEMLTEDERTRLSTQADVWATRQAGHRKQCPACSSVGLLTGTPGAAPVRSIEGDEVVERQLQLPRRFECVACRLKISGLPQLHAAALGDAFTSTNRYLASEFYGTAEEDEWDGYEEDNNEPF